MKGKWQDCSLHQQLEMSIPKRLPFLSCWTDNCHLLRVRRNVARMPQPSHQGSGNTPVHCCFTLVRDFLLNYWCLPLTIWNPYFVQMLLAAFLPHPDRVRDVLGLPDSPHFFEKLRRNRTYFSQEEHKRNSVSWRRVWKEIFLAEVLKWFLNSLSFSCKVRIWNMWAWHSGH